MCGVVLSKLSRKEEGDEPKTQCFWYKRVLISIVLRSRYFHLIGHGGQLVCGVCVLYLQENDLEQK